MAARNHQKGIEGGVYEKDDRIFEEVLVGTDCRDGDARAALGPRYSSAGGYHD